MAAPAVGPCEPWTTPEEIIACGCGNLELPADQVILDAAVEHASQVLFGLSGRQYPGACEVVVRPCFGSNCGCGGDRRLFTRHDFWWPFSGPPSVPVRIGGQWVNCGICFDQCHLPCVKLAGPIADVSEVLIDGAVLDPGAYKTAGFRRLCRVDGEDWPCTQDFTKEADEAGTWQITYTRGKPITANMRFYASAIGCEFANAFCGDETCLPPNVEQIVRDGVTVSFEDVDELFPDGKTGHEEIDQWLSVVNPARLARRGSIYRPDDPRVMRRFT